MCAPGASHLGAPETSYTYDTAGNPESMSSNHAHGVSATCGYDDLNRLTSIVDANLGGSDATSCTYDSAINLGTVKYPNNIETHLSFRERQVCAPLIAAQ
jgi:uncharacterized protein RhaS with RHS repeats